MTQFRFRWLITAIATVLWLCSAAPHAFSQATNTGTLVGQVTDPSGAVVADAQLTVTDAAAGTTLTATTNASGGFALTTVPPGTYTLTVTKSGFSVARIQGVVVGVGQQTTQPVKLSVGGSQQTVQVQASSESLQTLNSTVSQTIDKESIEALPSLNHDVNTFTVLQPGVSLNGSVAGAVNDQSTFILDGGNATNDMDGGNNVYMGSFAGDPSGGVQGQGSGVGSPTGALPTPQDSVQEVTVNTANQTADFDNSAGAQVEFVTPRGTNQWHGGVYEYYLDAGVGANSWTNNQTQTPLANYHYNRFGAKAGGWVLPAFWGGKTYLFAWYDGFRWPNAQADEFTVPSANMKAGILTEDGVTYNMQAIDPRGIGINPDVAAMWNKYEPTGNDTTCGGNSGTYCDGVNTIGYKANINLPTSSDDGAIRIDHDFSTKWHWFVSYRYYHLKPAADSQWDIGGFFAGDTLGNAAALGSRPQVPSYYVTGLTTNLTANTTNDFHYSILRDYWRWDDNNGPPQLPGLGGALEPGGETHYLSLEPYNVDTQDIRTRFWDGLDNFLSDNISTLKGNHLLQYGGQYQHNYDYHQRSDNGGGINFTPTYQLGDSIGSGEIDLSDLGGGFPYSDVGAARNAAEVYGMVTDAQQVYTRAGSTLALQPPLTHAFDKSSINYYNAYFSDTWHMKPSFTLTYGLGYTLEMPPTEAAGKQTVLVDTAGEPLSSEDYLAQRKTAAEQGNVYNPILGWDLVGNVGNGRTYPYNPFYGSFSPRVAFAWNPGFSKDTVLRGGYARIYGRLNGVDLVLVPLLGDGLMQAVTCRTAASNGTCAGSAQNADTAFRVGVDGNNAPIPAAAPTAPQPIIPGYNQLAGGPAEGMDPAFRPNDIDSFDLTIQRQVGQSSVLEVGYIGRLIHHEYQPVNLNAVPYMMSQGGQQFQNAYANLEKYLGCATSQAACGANVPASGTAAYTSYISSVTTQNFFETALAGTGYCSGYASCTAAVLDKELGNLETQAVWSMWSDMDAGNGGTSPGFNFSRTMMQTPILGQALGGNGQDTSGIALNASTGYGNYHGLFASFGTHNWHGLTMQSNFTYSKALGTGAVVQASSEYTQNDAYNLGAMYGEQEFDRRLVYNTYLVATEPWFKNQSGLLGRVAGGWQFAPIFSAGSGAPVYCNTWTDGQSFGAGDAASYFDNEQCVFTTPYNAGHSTHYGVTGDAATGVGTSTSTTPINMFQNPLAVWNQVRAPILGIDTKNPGVGPFMGLPFWNVDAQIAKTFRIAEATSFEFSFISTNLFNHNVLNNPGLGLGSPTYWGVINNQGNNPREMEFGGRFTF
ncbi:MAG: carboxypeptidase-like regulatory domain-containing protein [Acidobacteriaceae bacterium]